MTLTPHERFLVVTSLRQRAVQEANMHYAGNLDRGIARELTELADQLCEPEQLQQTEGWLDT